MLIIGYLFPLIFKKGYLNMKKGGSADPPRKVFLCSFLNYVRLNYAFSALEPAVIHYSRVDRRFVAVEESRHDLACYRSEHEAVTGEACSMPEFLNIGLAKYRCRIRGHVVVSSPLAYHADVLCSRKHLDYRLRDACY